MQEGPYERNLESIKIITTNFLTDTIKEAEKENL